MDGEPVSRKIAVAGSFVLDEVAMGRSRRQVLGGIAYNIRGLLGVDPDWEVIPVARVDEQARAMLREEFGEESRVNLRNLVASDGPCHRNRITLDGLARREEFSPGESGLCFGDFRGMGDVDGLIINMITPWDMDLPTARSLSAAQRCPIHLDVHSLVRTVSADGRWLTTTRPDTYGWTSVPDSVQMNAEEATAFTGFPVKDPEDARRLAMLVVLSGPGSCVITLGPGGAACAWLSGNRVEADLFSPGVKLSLDPPGAGDVFSSWFLWGMMEGKNPLRVARAAVEGATQFVKEMEVCNGNE